MKTSVEISEYSLAAKLLGRLQVELDATRSGAPDFVVVHPGDMTPDYLGLCGSAWTRLVSTTPTTNPPAAMTTPISDLESIGWVVVLEVGVSRCYNRPDDLREVPDPVVLDSASRDAIDDAAAMRRAVLNAFDDDDLRVVPGQWRPRGPMGMAHGGVMTCTIVANLCHVSPDDVIDPLPGDPRT